MSIEARSTQKIADTLHLSAKIVNDYHYHIKSKLGVTSDIELTLLGARLKIVDPNDLKVEE